MKKIYSKIVQLHSRDRMSIKQGIQKNLPETMEELKKSTDPYDKFLAELAEHLELLRKSKEKKEE